VPADGNCIVNVPDVAVKSPPKSKTKTELLVGALPSDLYICANFAVNVASVKDTSSKSTNAVDALDPPVTAGFAKVCYHLMCSLFLKQKLR
jgi:hypothetical protein